MTEATTKGSRHSSALPGSEALAGLHGASHSAHDHHPPARPFARLRQLLQPERREIAAVVIFAAAIAVLSLAIPIAVESLVNTVAFGILMWPLLAIAIVLCLALSLAAALRGLQTYIVESIQRRLFVRVVIDYGARLPKVRMDCLDSQHGPELVNRFFDVLNIQKALATLLIDGVALTVTVVVGMVVLASYHPFLLGFDIVLIASIAFILFVLGWGGVRTSLDESRAKYEVAAWLEELLRCPRAFKSAGGPRLALEKADQLADALVTARSEHFRVVWRQTLFALGLQVAASSALLGLGGWLVINRQLTLGQLVAAELIVTLVVASVAKIGKYAESYYDLMSGAEKLGIITDLPLDRVNGETFPEAVGGMAVRLGRRGAGQPHEIAAGERVAVVGASRELFDILCGLREPGDYLVELDRADIRGMALESVRDRTALVRGPELFLGTVLENVRVGRSEITPAEVREALGAVGLLEAVHDLPHGLDTPLIPSGGPLSGEESLRLTLARAIVGRPRLLLLDGALDAIDVRRRPEMLTRLFERGAPWTLIAASNNPKIIGLCDRIIDLTHHDGTAPSSEV